MKKINLNRTDYLVSSNNFMVGLGSVLNIFGNYFSYNYSNTDKEADAKALSTDWNMVGKDLSDAKEKFKKQIDQDLCLK